MKVAVGGIAVECCTFSPLPTRLEDLTILREDLLLAQYPFLGWYNDMEKVPLLRAKATPGGSLEPEVYSQIKSEFLEGLEQDAPWDGVYLDMHGALHVYGMEDAEGDWITSVRSIVGPDCLIAASYDLHGNVSERVIAGLDILTAYRTAPHEDVDETRARAFELLIGCLRDNIRPVCGFIPIPILLPGEMAMTTAEPTQGLYGSLSNIIAQYDLLDASYLVGYVWADEPRVGASAVAIGLDPRDVNSSLRALATEWWEQRTSFKFGMMTGDIDACIEMAQAAVQHGTPVFISDAGDNITGGGVGDVPLVLSHMLEADLQNAVYAAIVDAEAVEKSLAAGIGSEITVSLGGKIDTTHGTPLHVTGTVVGFNKDTPLNAMVVLQIGGVQTIVTHRRTAFTMLEQFKNLGIDLTACEIVGVKLGYLFPELDQIAKEAFLAFSRGAINPDIGQLPYQRLTRPIYPLDADMRWEPASLVHPR